MGNPYTSDERKYIKAIGDYRSGKLQLIDFFKKTRHLRDVSNRVRETHTVTGHKYIGQWGKRP